MGGSNSTPVAPKVPQNPASPPAECPMHNKDAKEKDMNANNVAPQNYPSECPMQQANSKPQTAPQSYPSECPMHQGAADGQKTPPNDIDPANMMPPPNQRPAPDQPFPLEKDRIISGIPKAGTKDNWVYPSEQMFWNAMLRKGWRWKEDDLEAKDMTDIIKIHNANNEQGWNEVLKWEALHAKECTTPALKKFGGKAKDFSPRARIRSWMGYELPFDRHDWIVDRCGKDVRYIIDYYDGGEVDKNFRFSILDVRPAYDSFGAFYDRTHVFFMRQGFAMMDWFSGSSPSSDNAKSDSATEKNS
ncbi:cytochrome c-type heme lyase-like [Mizuhopecten yessoensis]|uniref:Holocytochrome c-type synthase n=1 Tax=Mizuhopecten yessoensis TaxID=6573 RepID=A0A210PNT1_MIZYE|nr:cytochrome c-type heme lyase-like [Mizuhopecten yessoensis]OWF38165.1 Cytochrome c-type heme lyase [Mizuhopecten yessoensis]